MRDKELNNDLLARYAIFIATNEMGVTIEDNKIFEAEKKLAEEQIAVDPDLSEYLEFLKNQYIQIYQGLKEAGLEDVTFKGIQIEKTCQDAKVKKFTSRLKSPLVKYPAIALGSLLILIFSLVLISEVTKPPYFAIIENSSSTLLSVPREVSVSALDKGKTLFNHEKYSEANKIFNHEYQKLAGKEKQQERAICAYYLGLTYFKQANRSSFGLFPKYHTAQLDSSFKYIESSRLQLEGHPHFNLDLYWYLAIVETLRYSISKNKINRANAEKYLNLIIQRKSQRAEAARKLLALLNK